MDDGILYEDTKPRSLTSQWSSMEGMGDWSDWNDAVNQQVRNMYMYINIKYTCTYTYIHVYTYRIPHTLI